MNEISMSKVSKSFGFKRVLDNFSLDINQKDKVAIIGANGSGKTTLFNIIAGLESIDSGTLSIRKNATIGLLNQIPIVEEDITVMDLLKRNFQDVYEVEKDLRDLEEKMSVEVEHLDSLLKTYSKKQARYETMGGYEIEAKISKVVNGFKIKDELLNRKFNLLSGGEKTICFLASLILSSPDILLLDEPTNHLDVETLEWFEEYLKNYNGTVIIVSHDRYFLDQVVNKIVLIARGSSEIFFGNYSYYLIENEKRIMREFEDYKDQQKQIDAMKQKIKRLQEFGRLAAPEGGMFYRRAASIQKRLDRVELLDKPESKRSLPLEFDMETRSGKQVIVVDNLDLIIGDKILLDDVSFSIFYGEKIAITGANGTGKSTLIKKIMKNDCENIKIGSRVKIGYIAQEISFEDGNRTVLEETRKYFSGTDTLLRSALTKFMFYDDNIFKRVGKLSGGEKVRLKLFELIQVKANLLILDEPTNHIDIETREMLEEALLDFGGTILFISHDRYFVKKMADRVLLLDGNKVK